MILREHLEDRAFIDAHTVGFDTVAADAANYDIRSVAERTGVPPEAIEKAARMFAKATRAIALHARGLEHHSKGVENCSALINLCLATGHLGREGCGPAMITGQGNGQAGASTARNATSSPDSDRSPIPKAAPMWPRSGESLPTKFPRPDTPPSRSWKRFIAAKSRDCSRVCFNPLVSLPDSTYTRDALEKLEFFGIIDFFMSETARHADVVLAGSLQEEEEGVVCSTEGRVIHIQQAVTPPGNARVDSRIVCDLARHLARNVSFPTSTRERFLTNCVRPRAEASPTTTASRTNGSTASWACSGRVLRSIIRARRGCSRAACRCIPTASAASCQRRGAKAAIRSMRHSPVYLTTGRVVSQYLSGTQTRRIRRSRRAISGTAAGNAPAPCRHAGDPRRRLGDGDNKANGDDAASVDREDGTARHVFIP